MIKDIQISNFGPLKDIKWEKLSNINVVLGTNASGKTFFLKSLYSSIRTLEEYKKGKDQRTDKEVLSEKLHWTFQQEKIGDLVNKNSSDALSCKLIINDKIFQYSFGDTTVKAVQTMTNEVGSLDSHSVFLPPKEVLSLQNIILKSRELHKEFGFDDTYLDLIKALNYGGSDHDSPSVINEVKNRINMLTSFAISQQTSKRKSSLLLTEQAANNFYNVVVHDLKLSQKNKDITKSLIERIFESLHKNNSINSQPWDIKLHSEPFKSAFSDVSCKIENIIHGKAEYDIENARWWFKNNKNQKFQITGTAEGVKKIAIFDTLLSNGFISPDSIVFMDEPESALHPEAISKLMDVIVELAQRGVQFFIATHSYFVIKCLYILAQENKINMPVISSGDVDWSYDDLIDGMPDNKIIDESIRIYERELDVSLI
ncbi:AAA family ATPase [Aeromonas veronii]